MSYLPDIVIGGAPRSGTTFLCELLAKHPDVFIARPVIPEPKVLILPHPDDVAGYRARYEAFFRAATPGQVKVEKSSLYFENEDARQRFVRVLPDTRILFMLREPAVRAYSNWAWSTQQGLETLSFEDAIRIQGERPNPLGPDKAYARPHDYLRRSHYAFFARQWLTALGHERVGFFIFEEAIASPETFVARLQTFLGVDPLPWSELHTGRINANTIVSSESLDASLHRSLRDVFASEVEEFAALTGVDVSLWGY